MTPEQIKVVSGVLTLIGFVCLLRQIQWQLRVQRRRYPRLAWYWALRLADRQTVSAFLFLALTTLVVGQLMLSYLGVVAFGTTERGPIFYFAWCASVIWWNICTERHNGRKQRDDEDRWQPPLGSVAE